MYLSISFNLSTETPPGLDHSMDDGLDGGQFHPAREVESDNEARRLSAERKAEPTEPHQQISMA